MEVLVKWQFRSYHDLEWISKNKLDDKASQKLNKFLEKNKDAPKLDERPPFDPEYLKVEQIVKRYLTSTRNYYLVKWCQLPFSECTWEVENFNVLSSKDIERFNKNDVFPPSRQLTPFSYYNLKAQWSAVTKSPEYANEGTLLEHQVEGLNWLLFNFVQRKGCILADEMGLGKTIQSVSFVHQLFNKYNIRGPYMVVAPLSTLSHWFREFSTWTSMNAFVYHGTERDRKLMRENLFFFENSESLEKNIPKFHVLITTYEILIRDKQTLNSFHWVSCIFDEAHRLKNKNSKVNCAIREFPKIQHFLLLTGTPIQNNVSEIWTLLNIIDPNNFDGHQSFIEKYGSPETTEQVSALQKLLRPYLLRRTKEDVLKNIAAKEETIVQIELTAIQKQFYRAILEQNFKHLNSGKSFGNLRNIAMELRKCCSHPYLIRGAEEHISTLNAQAPLTQLIESSGKMVFLNKLLPKLRENGSKVLVFSQMAKCLDIIEDFLRDTHQRYERIDGTVSGLERQRSIDRFSQEKDISVFLLTTRAGGFGINLAAADVVVIFDSDWNPQNDLQAQSRCHRIGQTQQVKVYRLITRGTYEEEMFNRASRKLGLEKAIIGGICGKSKSFYESMSKAEVENLLRRGAYGLLSDEADTAARQFCEANIEEILETRTRTLIGEPLAMTNRSSTFSKAFFNVNDAGQELDVNDPSFWEKWAKKSSINVKKNAQVEDHVELGKRRKARNQIYRKTASASESDSSSCAGEDDDNSESDNSKVDAQQAALFLENHLLNFGLDCWKNIDAQENGVHFDWMKRKKVFHTTQKLENFTSFAIHFWLRHSKKTRDSQHVVNIIANKNMIPTEDHVFEGMVLNEIEKSILSIFKQKFERNEPKCTKNVLRVALLDFFINTMLGGWPVIDEILRSESPCSIEKVQEAFPAAPAVVVALVRGGYSLGNKGVKYAAKFAESPDKKLFGKKVFLFKKHLRVCYTKSLREGESLKAKILNGPTCPKFNQREHKAIWDTLANHGLFISDDGKICDWELSLFTIFVFILFFVSH
ncbi:chromodomain-helicase-DNA-binding protein 8-like [Zophobas morio]|uniref:chromodomain-helicase-DNA-binding protein 8-like n=1 Tax=Zophobas morio TaxID=2755281 RepID=UPI003082E677